MIAELTFFKQTKIQAIKLVSLCIRFWSIFEVKKTTQRLTKSSLTNVEFQGALDAMHFFRLQNIQANVTGSTSGLNNHLHDSRADFFQTNQNSSTKTNFVMYPIFEHLWSQKHASGKKSESGNGSRICPKMKIFFSRFSDGILCISTDASHILDPFQQLYYIICEKKNLERFPNLKIFWQCDVIMMWFWWDYDDMLKI